MTTSDPPAIVYLTLGSNIAPEHHLRQAVRLLRSYDDVLAISPVYRTAPQGYAQQADFLNMAVKLTTTRSLVAFKTQVIGEIEQQLGRVRDPNNKNAPRTIDLDIALWDDAVLDYGDKPWHIPDPDITQFAHVAVPLADLAPDYVHPENGQTLAQIAAQFDPQTMQRQALDFDAERVFIVNVEAAIWHDGRYLAAIRGEEEEQAAGALGFVGGKVETNATQENDILENTVRREIREEVGLEVSDVVYAHSSLFTTDSGEPVVNVIFLCRYHSGDLVIDDPGEVADAQWLPADAILNHPATPPWIHGYLQRVEQVRQRLGW